MTTPWQDPNNPQNWQPQPEVQQYDQYGQPIYPQQQNQYGQQPYSQDQYDQQQYGHGQHVQQPAPQNLYGQNPTDPATQNYYQGQPAQTQPHQGGYGQQQPFYDQNAGYGGPYQPGQNQPFQNQQPYVTPINPTWMGQVEPENYTPAPNYAPTQPIQPVWTHQQAKRTGRTLNIVLLVSITCLVVALLAIFLVLPNLYRAAGPAGIMVGFLLSLFPLAAVLLTVYFIDRWEPEPRWMLGFALLWGAAGSIGTTLLIQPAWVRLFMPQDLSKLEASQWLASFEAPPVEEFSKGLGILLIALFARKYFDGPVDGVVYAATIAAGFAFTENIQYFGRTFVDPDSGALGLSIIFIIRGIFSPFGHALYTACTGVAVGYAARKGNTGMIIGFFFIGLVPAMIFHYIWNSAPTLFEPTDLPSFLASVFLQSVVYEGPLLVLWGVGIYFLRKSEAKLTQRRLAEYAQSGWFTPEEVIMIATPAGRRNAMNWAKTFRRTQPMKEFIRKSTSLAYTRQRILVGASQKQNQSDEQDLLNEITALRPMVLN
ncbi:RsiW-degrading membrane proteinase PrsW (M82 family) [Psychromicrobium silvestre]|uniref:RsiW-degrading membrane proteinase PrsW (M82 family) n=1 Tax=Psychromicrobium silvestre TaxID=1645614 RepID=A0A7Y9LRN3_9MICC|nr:PrsW family intramembrane metalloprotease [Psychromicrobium silvestre]NYE94336.1 RsiW-degrading membrane proteinase PrsW (M82 family) [Psychromicrobium silvestre]